MMQQVRSDRHLPPFQSFPHTKLISRCGEGIYVNKMPDGR